MKQLRIAAALTVAVLVSCVHAMSAQREYYLTKQPYTWTDSTVSTAFVNVPERLQFQINVLMARSRAHQHEEVVCVNARSDSTEWWLVGDLYQADNVVRLTEDAIASYHCGKGMAALHTHWIARGNRCVASGTDTDRQNAEVGIPLYLIACGTGIDSLLAYRVKHRPLAAPVKAKL